MNQMGETEFPLVDIDLFNPNNTVSPSAKAETNKNFI